MKNIRKLLYMAGAILCLSVFFLFGCQAIQDIVDGDAKSSYSQEAELKYTLTTARDSWSVSAAKKGFNVVIPAEHDGLPVTKIDKSFASGWHYLESVSMSDNVTEIGDRAFYGCKGLTELKLSATLTKVGSEAFDGTAITELILPEGFTTAGSSAFACRNLTRIHIPSTMKQLGGFYFSSSGWYTQDYDKLTEIEINPYSDNFCFENGILYNKSKTQMYYSLTSISGDVTLPNNYSGNVYFANRPKITSVTAPDGVRLGGAGKTFYNCSSLTSVTISSTEKIIPESSFSGCEKLTAIQIPASVTSIGKLAFYGCKAITEVRIPNSVTKIESGTFSSCDNLADIYVPLSIKSIDLNAFSVDTSKLTIHYQGTTAEWFKISNADKFSDIKKEYMSY
ncbi:hypothetical protein FACS1894211_01530 [Clostridia bacterium]|nr:hypothetical protein FACS1894211_01530 [Clostridia bacterium]